MLNYLEQLTVRLTLGVAALPEAIRQKHTNYLLDAQRADGGFAGRQGDSDLYYTGFGLRGLAVLGHLEGDVAERAARFLRSRLEHQVSIVDFLSLMYGAALLELSAGIDVFAQVPKSWEDAVIKMLNSLRRDDGGYAKGPEGNASSTYHTFLVLLCLQLLGAAVADEQGIVGFLLSQRSEDGGFLEIRASKRAGTNPTAAAIAALRILDGLNDEIRDDAVDFLADMQTDEGGIRANTRIPIADLLSTFTGTLTLADLDAFDSIDISDARKFVESLQRDEGGFHGAAWDDSHDVEYTFYGLGGLAILSAPR